MVFITRMNWLIFEHVQTLCSEDAEESGGRKNFARTSERRHWRERVHFVLTLLSLRSQASEFHYSKNAENHTIPR